MTDFRNGDLYSIEVVQTVDTDRTIRTLRGDWIRPVKIRHWAYIYQGRYYRTATLLDADRDNVALDTPEDMTGWPSPPHWFDVEALRLKLLADEWVEVAS